VKKMFSFFVIHQSAKAESNFVHRTSIPLSLSPRFSTEILTPIVRLMPGERVVIRLTNNSRDGVSDTVTINDSLAVSTLSPFLLSSKGSSHQDTLLLTWTSKPVEGDYLISLKISGVDVGRFAVRKFETLVDSTRRVGVIPAVNGSPAVDAIRRLNLHPVLLEPDTSLVDRLTSLDVVIVDRRALTLRRGLVKWKEYLEGFVERGGHLIVLAQDAEVWNQSPLWDGLRLTRTFALDEDTPVLLDSNHRMLSSPNTISAEDFDGWLFLKAYNEVKVHAERQSTIVRAGVTQSPLLVSIPRGKGSFTYVDLALHPQWLNIHAGALRLLANMVSF